MTRTMKDSGIEWIGEIPENWSISKVKHCFTRKNSKAKQDDPIVLSLARSGVKVRDISTNEGQLAESYYDYNPVQVGDLLLNPMDLYSGANCSYSDVEGVISPAYINLKNKEGVSNSKFYDYYFKVQYWMMVLFSFGKGVSFDNRWTLGQETLMNFPIVYPSLPEQQKIADFLDEKCSHIDSVLEKTRASIEEYKQLKQSVITKAVTKGIRPNRPMKDSGIEWIGEIPEDWEIRKFKYVLSNTLQYGANESGVPYDSSLPRYIRITDITQDGKLKETDKLSLPKDVAQPFILKDGDILFARSGGTVGKSFIYKAEYEESCFAGYLIRATIKETVLPKLVYYWTCSSIYEEWKNSIFIQATIQNIGADKYSNMPIMYIRNKEEQQEIVAYLDDKCSEIDTLIAKKEQLIEELETYKKSLIYEYVTGKKEVC